VWLLVLVPAQPVLAQTRNADLERAEAKAIEAKAFFQSGLFVRAAEGFLQAFAISRRSEMMFNAARAYEEARMPAESIALFGQYVKLPDTTEASRADAQERIQRQRKVMEQQGMTPPPAVKPEPRPEVKPEPIAAPKHENAGKPKPVMVAVAPTPEPPPPARNKYVTYGLLGGGTLLALIALGGYNDAKTRVDAANRMDFGVTNAAAVYAAQIKTAHDQRNVDAFVGLVGVGLIGWGAWRLWGPSPKPQAAAWIAPTLGPDGTGVALGGGF
jgi:hypothetical protein